MDSFWHTIHGVELTTTSAVFRIFLSLVLGSIVGVERKRKGQMAGLRTFALISMGACIAMMLSIYVCQETVGLLRGDPSRIAAQVISGIGFLGAGTIIQMKGSVRGLTTAAGIWIIATIGMAVGCGLYIIAMVATGLVLVVLIVLEQIEHKVNVGNEARTIRLKVKGIVKSLRPYEEELSKFSIHLSRVYVEYDYENDSTRLNLLILIAEKSDFVDVFDALHNINPTISISLSNQADIS
ncbi:MAG: MgtC/SapB family protein [Duncaniella sp.]|nr:MgtC/SapB family protein [Duncaniella sp.]MDE6859310.1 MgtC/SapB family protein [Duncaniella sp.]MDE7146482.1 MgtC/SapB family protein [Duncaniella sp.]